MTQSASLQAIVYSKGRLQLLDQRLLPLRSEYLDINTVEDAFQAIRDMVVRGAPAIGVTAALATAVELHNLNNAAHFKDLQQLQEWIDTKMTYLAESRPTAVNLMDACNRIKQLAHAASAATTPATLVQQVEAFAERYFADDVATNKAIGAHGATALLAAARAGEGAIGVLTHCNTGSLATAGHGTALGVIRSLAGQGRLQHVYATETRPYNQGARLTAYELQYDGLPATLIADSAATSLIAAGKVQAVVVGADRVAANGDTANKIGTCTLATAAAAHGVAFFVAAPTTTLDPACPSGKSIVIEERPPEELTHFRGERVVVEGMQVWNPSFDVTPAALIEGIITEKGVIERQPDGTFDVAGFLKTHNVTLARDHATPVNAVNGAAQPSTSVALTESTVKQYVAARPHLAARVGPVDTAPSWAVQEVSDGNINFVFLVQGPVGGVCIKQGLGFVRCVGEAWPLSQDRIRFEAETMQEAARHCPQHLPEIFEYDPATSVIAMELIPPPHQILRKGLLEGLCYPQLAQHMAGFLASTLFNTSLWKLRGKDFRLLARRFCNPDMCELTEGVVFTDPFHDAQYNRWTSPQLDADAKALWSDMEARQAATALKALFCQKQEALLHGDLHLGSLMVTPDSTYVIDAEFAFAGPIAFDVAKFVFDLLLTYVALEGHKGASRAAQRAWLLQAMRDTWTGFVAQFRALWNGAVQAGEGELSAAALYGPAAVNGPAALKEVQDAYFASLWREVVAFGGVFMIRRLVGIAHVLEMESIEDVEVRAACERKALRFGRELLVHPERFASVHEVVEQAQKL